MRYIEPPYSAERTKEFLSNAGLCDNPLIYAAENDEGKYVGFKYQGEQQGCSIYKLQNLL